MKYDIVYADPPWSYPTNSKFGGAATHYDLMTDEDLLNFDMRSFMNNPAWLFCWATCPRLDFAIKCIESWGLHYRGIAFVWVKTVKDGSRVLGPAGVPPACVKPVSEFVIVATTNKNGRATPLQDYAMEQIIFHPRGQHSEKPAIVRDNIVTLLGDIPRIELFARQHAFGWDAWGNDPNLKKVKRKRGNDGSYLWP